MGTEQLAVRIISSTCMPTILYVLYYIILYLNCMYCMYLNPTHRVANKLLSLSLSLYLYAVTCRPTNHVRHQILHFQTIVISGFIGFEN